MARMRATITVLALLLLARGAAAAPPGADPDASPPPPPEERQPKPEPPAEQRSGPRVVEHGSPEVEVEQEVTPEQGRGVQYGAHLVVPLWVTEPFPGQDVSPGLGVQGRIGWEFPKGLSTELIVGYMLNRVDLTAMDEDVDLTNVWVGAGARYALLNPSAFVPFLGLGLQLDFWDTGGGDNLSTVGFNGTVGAIFEVTAKVGIEVGVVANVSTEGDAGFDGAQVYLSPFAGGTLYF